MKIFTYDCGYSVALIMGRRPHARVYHVRLPFPATAAGWRFLIRKWKCDHGMHDYLDGSEIRTPHRSYEYTCRHCGKDFEI